MVATVTPIVAIDKPKMAVLKMLITSVSFRWVVDRLPYGTLDIGLTAIYSINQRLIF